MARRALRARRAFMRAWATEREARGRGARRANRREEEKRVERAPRREVRSARSIHTQSRGGVARR
jgi:hypothetical protein